MIGGGHNGTIDDNDIGAIGCNEVLVQLVVIMILLQLLVMTVFLSSRTLPSVTTSIATRLKRNKLAKARKTRKSSGTLGLKKFDQFQEILPRPKIEK